MAKADETARVPGTQDPDFSPRRRISDGMGLCLSGGGYRAVLFHLGSLRRLHELGLLAQVQRISSVSGGSIVAGYLGLHWQELFAAGDADVEKFIERIEAPLLRFVRHTIDRPAIFRGLFRPGKAAEEVAAQYDRLLFHGATLQNLPRSPSIIFNATNLQSGVLWRFSRAYTWDYRVGAIDKPRLPLATAVAASTAFPPFLSPLILNLGEDQFRPGTGQDLQMPPYTTRVLLTDGGVYDNLGLETVLKNYRRVFVSDGGGRYEPVPRPWWDWLLQSKRVLFTIDNQVRNLRKRELLRLYRAKIPRTGRPQRSGAYWGIWSDIANFPLDDALCAPVAQTHKLADTETRLGRIKPPLAHRLVNWGYAVCDAALRSHYLGEDELADKPVASFPYPGGVG